MKYRIYIKRIYIEPIIVTASNKDEAKKKANTFLDFGATEDVELENESWPVDVKQIRNEDIEEIDEWKEN